jgi:polyhydroxyalkanoate synthesis regulator protein
MYDTTTKRDVTMDDIAELVQSGESITIIDNASGEDITQEIVSQLVGRVLDGQAKKLPLSVLVDLMRKGSGGLMDFSKKYISFWQGALNYAGDELDKVQFLIGRQKSDATDDSKTLEGDSLSDQEALLSFLDERIQQQTEKIIDIRDKDIKKQISRVRSDITKLKTRIDTFETLLSQALSLKK